MRVLLTTDTVGGVWTFTRELTEALLQQDNSVALASFGRVPSAEQIGWASTLRARHPESFSFIASDIPLEWMAENERTVSEGDAVLSQIIDQFAPDLLHSNQFCFGALPSSLPRLVTAHSDVLSWAEACRPQGLDTSPWLERYCHIVQQGLNSATTVTAPTRAMLDALARNFNLPPAQHVIANGRSLPLPQGPPSPRRLQAVTAGRLWDEAKNIALLARVHSAMLIVVAGEQSFPEAQTAVTAASLHFTGALAEPQLLRLFQSSAVYIAPSLYEPFGLAPLEAALCGCAILANDLSSLREVWGNAATFFSNAREMEAQLQLLAENPHRLVVAQQKAHARALTLSRDAMATRYLELYRDLVRTSRASFADPPDRERQRVA